MTAYIVTVGGTLKAIGVQPGISQFVSLGNKLDVGENDLLRHWERGERTEVIQLYLESFPAGRSALRDPDDCSIVGISVLWPDGPPDHSLLNAEILIREAEAALDR